MCVCMGGKDVKQRESGAKRRDRRCGRRESLGQRGVREECPRSILRNVAPATVPCVGVFVCVCLCCVFVLCVCVCLCVFVCVCSAIVEFFVRISVLGFWVHI